jgi:hypothetical protein
MDGNVEIMSENHATFSSILPVKYKLRVRLSVESELSSSSCVLRVIQSRTLPLELCDTSHGNHIRVVCLLWVKLHEWFEVP